MTVGDVYDPEPIIVYDSDSLMNAAQKCCDTGISDLMVVDKEGNFKGVCSEGDLIRACMPDYAEIRQQGLTHDEIFETFVDKGHEKAQENVMSIAVTDPISVFPTTHLQKAASYMVSKNIRRLPVLESGKLVGTVSRAMVAKAILSTVAPS